MHSEATTTPEKGWERLEAQLDLSGGFWLGFVFSAAPQAVNTLWLKTEALLKEREQLVLQHPPIQTPDELPSVLTWLLTATEPQLADCVWIESIRADPPGASEQPWTRAWEQLFLRTNEHRDALRARLPGGLVFAAPPSILPLVREAAPDLWSIRSLVVVVDVPLPKPTKTLTVMTTAPAELMALLGTAPAAPAPRAKTMLYNPGGMNAPPPAPSSKSRFTFPESERQTIEALIAEGRLDDAEERTRHALDALDEHDKLERAFALRLLALVHRARGAPRLALQCFERAIAAHHEAMPDLVPVEWYEAAARLAAQKGDPEQARQFLATALMSCRKRLQVKETVDVLQHLAFVSQAIGDIERDAGNRSAAETAFDEAVIVSRRLVDLRDDLPECLASLAASLLSLGDIRADKGDFAGAIAAFEEMRKQAARICHIEHDSRASLRRLSIALTRLGGLKQETRDHDGAKAALYEALSLRRGIANMGEDPQSLRDLASVLSRVGHLELALGDLATAAYIVQESVLLERKFCSLTGRSAYALHELAVSLFRLGEVRQKQFDREGAACAYRESIDISRELDGLENAPTEGRTTLEAAERALASLQARA